MNAPASEHTYNYNQAISSLEFTRCTFASEPTLYNPTNAAAWDYRWVVNGKAKYQPQFHKQSNTASGMTLDGYEGPTSSVNACIFNAGSTNTFCSLGPETIIQNVTFDRCAFNGNQVDYIKSRNPKWKVSGGQWTTDTGWSEEWGTYYHPDVNSYAFSGCMWAANNNLRMFTLNTEYNNGIPLDVLQDLHPTASYLDTGVLSSCDELRAAGYDTVLNGGSFDSMSGCIDNYDSKTIVTDGNNKFMDATDGRICQNIRTTDGWLVEGNTNFLISCEDMVREQPIVGNTVNILNIMHREHPTAANDYSIYSTTFTNDVSNSLQTGTSEFPVYIVNPLTSYTRCQCEDLS